MLRVFVRLEPAIKVHAEILENSSIFQEINENISENAIEINIVRFIKILVGAC